ncbi:hypothetical protein DPMN_167531 [Dreissena polymorpha]|uniref:Uncharacterized protein n=1 Tax=Dreissena polymorpha TaxID=45954 RepID=A0A9D4EZ04_DREPO|nr:hypothetical protein DPMN_167531 [Dreissena polymorpha]
MNRKNSQITSADCCNGKYLPDRGHHLELFEIKLLQSNLPQTVSKDGGKTSIVVRPQELRSVETELNDYARSVKTGFNDVRVLWKLG